MPTTQLNSTAIRQLDYEPQTKKLVVHFVSGSSQEYSGITEETYQAFVNAPSAGRFYHQNIKQG